MDLGALIGDSRVGGLLSVVGVALAISSYFWRREKTLLRYTVAEASIASARNQGSFKDDFEIYFRKQQVPTVTSTAFWIWNGGNKLIRSNDIADTDRLRLALPPGSKILQCQINKSSRPVNNVRYVLEDGAPETEMVLDFDFLEPNEGFVFTLLHTAPRRTIALQGTIINSPKSPVYSTVQSSIALRSARFEKKLTASLAGIMGTTMLLPVFFPWLNETPIWLPRIDALIRSPWFQGIFSALCFGYGLFVLYWRRSSRLPASLEDAIL
ncbi:hypothetical protein E0J18_11775 [Rhizobium leguminosarum bv. viciae]|nr:hypothetical protein E0J18_11775 [Rhizobium leguminosarum bv. viciae]